MIAIAAPAHDTRTKKKKKGFGEMAGATAADCAAVCCCCPCALVDLLVWVVVKVPAGLYKKVSERQPFVMMERKKKQQQRCLLAAVPEEYRCSGGGTGEELEREVRDFLERGKFGCDGETETIKLEKEMLDRFWEGGFWRSSSPREVGLHDEG